MSDTVDHRRRLYEIFYHHLVWQRLFFLALVVSYTLSILPGEAVAPLFNWSDKLNHAVAFWVLAFLLQMGWKKITAFKTTVLLMLYGAFIEFSQLFAIRRSAELADVAADSIGIVLGLILVKLLRKI